MKLLESYLLEFELGINVLRDLNGKKKKNND